LKIEACAVHCERLLRVMMSRGGRTAITPVLQ
jgi:hypothetical protein